MLRLPIPPERIAPTVALTGAEAHYLLDVMRLKSGDTLEVFDGVSRRFRATLGEGQTLTLEAIASGLGTHAPITLAQGLAKGDKMELVIQKATELGVNTLAPFDSERAVVKLEGARALDRVDRWRKIAASAAAQCGRVDIPTVAPIVPLATLLETSLAAGDLVIVLYENERTLRLASALGDDPRPLVLVIGPEGGFSEGEIERARHAGAKVATLGDRVLRTETVGLAVLSVVQHLRGELG